MSVRVLLSIDAFGVKSVITFYLETDPKQMVAMIQILVKSNFNEMMFALNIHNGKRIFLEIAN